MYNQGKSLIILIIEQLPSMVIDVINYEKVFYHLLNYLHLCNLIKFTIIMYFKIVLL